MGLGLAHNVFDGSNAMLALNGVFKFFVKNVSLFNTFYFVSSIFDSSNLGFLTSIPFSVSTTSTVFSRLNL